MTTHYDPDDDELRSCSVRQPSHPLLPKMLPSEAEPHIDALEGRPQAIRDQAHRNGRQRVLGVGGDGQRHELVGEELRVVLLDELGELREARQATSASIGGAIAAAGKGVVDLKVPERRAGFRGCFDGFLGFGHG